MTKLMAYSAHEKSDKVVQGLVSWQVDARQDRYKDLFTLRLFPEVVDKSVEKKQKRTSLANDPNQDAEIEPDFKEVWLLVGDLDEESVAFDGVPFELEYVDGEAASAEEFGVCG